MASGLTFNLYGRDVSASSSLQKFEKQAAASGEKIKRSLTGIGKTVLAGTGVVGLEELGSKSVEAADKLEGANIKIEHVFGESSKQVQTWSKGLATSFGISQAAAEDTAGTFAQMLAPLGKGPQITAVMSEKLTTLTADMARFNNADPAQVQSALIAGLRGRATALRQYGVDLSASAVKEEAVREGLIKQGGTLTDAAKTQASYNLILKQTANQQGAVKDSSKTLAQQHKILTAEVTNLEANLGTKLQPVLVDVGKVLLDDVVPAMSSTVHWVKENETWVRPLAISVGALWGAWKLHTLATDAIGAVNTKLGVLRTQFGRTTATVATEESAQTRTIVANSDRQIAALTDVQAAEARAGAAGGARIPAGGLGGARSTGGGGVFGKLVGRALAGAGIYMAGTYAGDKISGNSKPGSGRNNVGLAVKEASHGAGIGEFLGGPVGATVGAGIGAVYAGFKSGANQTPLGTQLKGFVQDMKLTKAELSGVSVAAKINADAVKQQAAASRTAIAAQTDFNSTLSLGSTLARANGTSLDAQTTAGKTNRSWLLDEIKSVQTVASEQLKAGVSTDTITAKFHGNETALRNAAVAAGFNRDQVAALIAKYGKLPKSVSTAINLHDNASSKIRHIAASISQLHGKTVYISAIDITSRGLQTMGSAGVLTKAAAQGTGFLKPRHYAQGGRVPVWVGENGPELLSAPIGSQVTSYTSAMSQARMGAGRGGGNLHLTVNIHGQSLITKAEVGQAIMGALEVAARRGFTSQSKAAFY